MYCNTEIVDKELVLLNEKSYKISKERVKDIVNFIKEYYNSFYTVEELESMTIEDPFSEHLVFNKCQKLSKMLKVKINSCKNLLPELKKGVENNDIMSIVNKFFKYCNDKGETFVWCYYMLDNYSGDKYSVKKSKQEDNDYFELVYIPDTYWGDYGKQIKSPYGLLWERTKFLIPFTANENDAHRIVSEDAKDIKKGYFKESDLLKRFSEQAKTDKYLKSFSDELTNFDRETSMKKHNRISAIVDTIREHQKKHINRFIEIFFQILDEDIVYYLCKKE